jgi:hypothetical protein
MLIATLTLGHDGTSGVLAGGTHRTAVPDSYGFQLDELYGQRKAHISYLFKCIRGGKRSRLNYILIQ